VRNACAGYVAMDFIGYNGDIILDTDIAELDQL